jgi:hypothetical protein
MAEIKKQWKEREELSISELEDIWFANRNLEMARSIILAVKDFQKISLEEKLEFLRNVFYEESNLWDAGAYGKLEKYIKGPLLETFLFLLPEWKQEFAEKTENGRLIINLLSYKDIYSHISVSAGQIKKFIHSYLNNVKKEEMEGSWEESWIVDILINNRMFEELVNYNFVSDRAVEGLWDFLFSKENKIWSGSYFRFLFSDATWLVEETAKQKLRIEKKEKIKSHLLSWDKVENRHALSTLWTLLAKRGDLKKIFEDEKAKEIKKAE